MPEPITEDDVITLLKPLTVDDIVISTKPYYLEIDYLYNNLNFKYVQTDPKYEGNLQASIRATHDKPASVPLMTKKPLV